MPCWRAAPKLDVRVVVYVRRALIHLPTSTSFVDAW
jgi:hypothetical protein